ncbi:MAG: toll/interleukin-1 receptor domain-containing protein [Saprospirales bacterium]|nr:toll/interleukin-1 receptor domain-containing protein [Saprospirales bacterium]
MKQNSSVRIFINYRKDDTGPVAENIYHRMTKVFGEAAMFIDEQNIETGEYWDETILTALESAVLVLAVIGDKWLTLHDAKKRRRIDGEDDWVRKELEVALRHGKTIIPIYIEPAERLEEENFNHPNGAFLKDNLPKIQGIAKVNSRSLEKDLHELIYKTIPGLGIQPLLSHEGAPREIDILANYPLSVQPDKNKLPAPYVGLRPFDTKEAFLFFGRDNDILKLIKKIESADRDNQILLYHGRSGVGKSSILTAGLYPRIKTKAGKHPNPAGETEKKAWPPTCSS